MKSLMLALAMTASSAFAADAVCYKIITPVGGASPMVSRLKMLKPHQSASLCGLSLKLQSGNTMGIIILGKASKENDVDGVSIEISESRPSLTHLFQPKAVGDVLVEGSILDPNRPVSVSYSALIATIGDTTYQNIQVKCGVAPDVSLEDALNFREEDCN